MDKHFTALLDRARASVLVKDQFGYCVYDSRSAEALRGFPPSEIEGKHTTEITAADPYLVERQYERLRRDQAWVGQYPVRKSDGDTVTIRAYNFLHQEWDGNCLYAAFEYAVDGHQRLSQDGPIKLQQDGLTPAGICFAQFCVDGYTDEEIATLLGTGAEHVDELARTFITAMGVASRTAACVGAIKSRLVVSTFAADLMASSIEAMLNASASEPFRAGSSSRIRDAS